MSGIDIGEASDDETIQIYFTGLQAAGRGQKGPFNDQMPISGTPGIQTQPFYAHSRTGETGNYKYTLSFTNPIQATGIGQVERFISGLVEVWKPITEVTGLHHLEGRTVSIGVDGDNFLPQTVTDGKVRRFRWP